MSFDTKTWLGLGCRVIIERSRQQDLLSSGKIKVDCSDPNVSFAAKLSTLGEEYGEVCRAYNDNESVARVTTELVQLIAVATAMYESLEGADDVPS